ncbi:MAG: hypothetical protein ABSB90_09660 [Thermoplasmata archaeon]|jgi:hypothetical protein
MAGGVSGATSGGILGLVLVLLAQQFGYVVFDTLEQTLILLILVIFLFAVVFGILGRILKASAIRRAKASVSPPTGAPSASGSPPGTAPPEGGEAPASVPPPSDPGPPPTP